MAGKSLTSASAIIMLAVPDLFSAPNQLQEFSADDIFSATPIQSNETSMGVDGKLSAGFVFNAVAWTVSLQANSPSVAFVRSWRQQEVLAKEAYAANAVVTLLGTKEIFNLTKGFITTYPTMPDAAKILRPLRFTITWESVTSGNV